MAANELTCLYLLPILHEYRRLYPEVHITVQRALGSRVPAQVLDYGADFGVDHLPARSSPALNSIVVYHDELAFVVPPTHPLARRAECQHRELGSESFVAHHVSSPYRARVIETFRKKRVELRMPVEMPTIDAIKKFVAMGNGVALLPAITVEPRSRTRSWCACRCRSWRSIATAPGAAPRGRAVACRAGVPRRRREHHGHRDRRRLLRSRPRTPLDARPTPHVRTHRGSTCER